MIDLILLEQLIAFNDFGTLSKAAEQLNISQPALTRSMQRLEDELGIQLFIRTKNRMTLTDTGYYTVSQARQLLRHTDDFYQKIHQYALQQVVLYVGASAPGPLYKVEYRAKERKLEQKLNTEMADDQTLREKLLNEECQLVITDKPIDNPKVITELFFNEVLSLTVPPDHPLADREFVTKEDLAGLTMLLRTQLGIWEDFVNQLTETTFIKQSEPETFNALVVASNLPSFITNVSKLNWHVPENRIKIPIKEDAATIPFYMNSLKKHRHLMEQLL